MQNKQDELTSRLGRLYRIRKDEVFGVMEYYHYLLSEPLFVVVWLDTKEQVPMTGAFFNRVQAEEYTKEHRKQLIDKKFEEIILN